MIYQVDPGVLGLDANSVGGIEPKVVNLVRHLGEFDDLVVISTKLSSDLRRAFARVSFVEIPSPWLPISRYPPPSRFHSSMLVFPLLVFSVRVAVCLVWQKIPPGSTLHFHNKFSGFVPAIVGKIRRATVVYTEHNVWPWIDRPANFQENVLWRLHMWFSQIFFRLVDGVIALSPGLRDALIAYGKLERMRIAVVPSLLARDGSITTPARFTDNSNLVLFIGRLEPVKNPLLLLRALPFILARVPGARVVILGDGSQRAHLILEAERLGVRNHVVFKGQVPHDQVMAATKEASVVVFCSSVENYPSNALLETLAMGRPVVASDAGDTSLLVKPFYNGLLFAPEKVEELAAAVCNILTDRELRIRMSAGAADSALAFHPRTVASETWRAYQSFAPANGTSQ